MRLGLTIGMFCVAFAANPIMAKDLAFVVADCAIAAGAKTVSYVAPVGADKPLKDQVAGIKFHRKMKLTKAQEQKIKSCTLAKAK